MLSVNGSSTKQHSMVWKSLWAAALYALALLAVFHETTWPMVSTWIRSETYAHGFLILPISVWLVWHQRVRLAQIHSRPALWVAALILPVGFVWLLAYLVDVLVVQQLTLVTMLLLGVWAIVGHTMARAMAFPLLFLFFAVPMGDPLIAPLMEFTATSTVWLIQQTGVPVFREGLYFSLPSGNWSVVEACSGQRYLIASVTLGVLYAYLTYSSFKRRFWFVLASIIVPIFANAIRAYIIVMLGHLSGMTIATGVDHLVYGWVFFGLVMFVLFWIGSLFREDETESAAAETASAVQMDSISDAVVSKLVVATAVVLVAAALWPLLAYTTVSSVQVTPHIAVLRAEAGTGWRSSVDPNWQWQPDATVTGQNVVYLEHGGNTVGLYIQYRQGDEGEVVGSSTRFTQKESGIRVAERGKVKLQLGGIAVEADRALLNGRTEALLAYSWYRVGGRYTSNNYLAKFFEALGSLGLGSVGSYRIVLVTPLVGTPEVAQETMQSFLDEFAAKLNLVLGPAIEPGG